MRTQAKHGGFTLIELVVVITILAILAAFAVPRFASLEVEARSASTTALGGSVRSAAALAHALWLAQGQPQTVSMEGHTITIVNGYPDESSIDDALASIEGFIFDDAVSPSLFAKSNGGSPPSPVSDCQVTYEAAAVPGAAPDIQVKLTGC